MKKIAVIFLFVFCVGNLVTAKELKWMSWNEGYALAKKENKTMMLFVQTSWCNWCKRMNDKTFSNEAVADLVNKKLIAVKLDPESKETYSYEGKDYSSGELISLLSNEQVKGIPSTVFYNPETKKSELAGGFIEAKDFKKILKKKTKKKK